MKAVCWGTWDAFVILTSEPQEVSESCMIKNEVNEATVESNYLHKKGQIVGNWMGIKDPNKASRIDQIDEIDTIVFHSTNL